MIQVQVAGLSLSKMGFVLLLQGLQDKRTLPIFIGAAEAQSIALHLAHAVIPRPLTHDLMKILLDCLECRLKKVEISRLVENTFYARLVMEHDAVEFDVDARPSDAIALALRCASPIYVARTVMDQAGMIVTESGDALRPDGKAAAHPHAEPIKNTLSPIEALQELLNKAVVEERYEDAARLRDEIQKLKQPHSTN